MSSLMQFRGDISRTKGVRLEFVLVEQTPPGSLYSTKDVDVYLCPDCGREHSHIYLAWRKPCGMLGPWVKFRFNGETHVPTLSIPISVFKIPRGAKRLDSVESSRIWHS